MTWNKAWVSKGLAAAMWMVGCGDSTAGSATEASTPTNPEATGGTTGGTTRGDLPTTSGSTSESPSGTQTGTESATGTTGGPAPTTGVVTTGVDTTGPVDTSTGPVEPGTSTGETGTGETGDTGTADTGTSTTDDTTTGSLMEFCEGEGGIKLPGDETCTGDLGEKTFVFALCSCTNVNTLGTFVTDSFNSNDMNMPVMDGGSVGVNGNYTATVLADIGGALWVDGKVTTTLFHDVARNLQCGGDYNANVISHVGGDAFIEGNIGGLLPLMTIDGDLHIPQGKATLGANVLGQTIKGPVDVQTPCDCSEPLNIAAIVQGYKADNDNAVLGFESDDLQGLILPKVVELPCGRYFFDEISSLTALTIKITGRTVIAVEGDVNDVGLFNLEIGPDAELDLFVTGDMTFIDLATVGDTKRPAALRMYVHGAVTFANLFTLGGNLYQPNAVFNAAGLGAVWGSLFVGGINLVDLFSIHYDAAVLELDGCEQPGGSCGDCHDCLNPTPSCGESGKCEPCKTDSDCCPPFLCSEQGQCFPAPG